MTRAALKSGKSIFLFKFLVCTRLNKYVSMAAIMPSTDRKWNWYLNLNQNVLSSAVQTTSATSCWLYRWPLYSNNNFQIAILSLWLISKWAVNNTHNNTHTTYGTEITTPKKKSQLWHSKLTRHRYCSFGGVDLVLYITVVIERSKRIQDTPCTNSTSNDITATSIYIYGWVRIID